MAEYSKALAERVKEYLESQKWRFTFDEEDGIFRFGISLDNKMQTVRVFIPLSADMISVYAVSPITADADSMLGVSSFIARANYGLKLGNFELDLRDGEVRYKSTLFCGDTVPALAVVERVVDVTFQMMDRYGNGLLNIIFSGADPAQEIAKIED